METGLYESYRKLLQDPASEFNMRAYTIRHKYFSQEDGYEKENFSSSA